MTPLSPAAGAASSPSSAQWLALLTVGAIALAGWVQSWKWQKVADAAEERARVNAEKLQSPGPDPGAANPTLSLMQDVDLIRQNELLSEENKRLSIELKQLQEQADKDRERAALDGSGGTLR